MPRVQWRAPQEDRAALSGVTVISRWPIGRQSIHTFGDLRVQYAEVSGPREPIQVYGALMDAWWFDQSQPRQDSVLDLLTHMNNRQDERVPLVVSGDFNADPDSDEIRMLRGRTSTPVPGLFCNFGWISTVVAPPFDMLRAHSRKCERS